MSKIEDSKEIEVLDDWEHVLMRPQVYVSSVNMSEQKVPIIKDGKIVIETRSISVGFYKLLNEILDNAVDEAKRMNGTMPSISVKIDSKTNVCEVIDTGDGFSKASNINKKSKKTNVETAMSQLKAGSNFKNQETESSIVGMNGMGAALVNILSDEFFVDTQNADEHFRQEWTKFETKGPKITTGLKRQTGTTVGFRPRKGVFRGCSWDKDVVFALMSFKRFLLKNDSILKNVEFNVEFDGEILDLDNRFLPKEAHIIKSRLGVLAFFPNHENSGSISFVNSAMCTGIHQKIVNEFINAELDDPLGHHFYETFFVLNMAPRLISFGDQNKTRLDSERKDIQGSIIDAFRQGMEAFFSTDVFADIRKKVEDRKMGAEVNKLRKAKKNNANKISTKYFPPSGQHENVYICEGLSAAGGVNQIRNPKTEGVFALKGKIKNVRSVSDLSSNEEIIQLMSILDLDLDPSKRSYSYKRIIIAADADCLHENTLVMTDKGLIKISDIDIDTKVCIDDKLFKIIDINEKISNEWIEINLDGEKFKCTAGHIWPVYRDGQRILVRADEIKETDFMIKNVDMSEILVNPKIKKVVSNPQRFIDLSIDSDTKEFLISSNGSTLFHTHNCDGGHISSLFTNFLCRWFPYVVDEGRLYRLQVPLVSAGSGKSIEYFYTMNEFKASKNRGTVRYLKGLGSLSVQDWEHVMANKRLQQIKRDDQVESIKYLKMAFDSDSGPRKSWLKGEDF